MSERFPSANTDAPVEQIDLHEAANAAKQQLEQTASNATYDAYWAGSDQGKVIDSGSAEYSTTVDSERNPDGTYTVRESVASHPTYETVDDLMDSKANTDRVMSSTTETIAPAKGVLLKKPDMENAETVRTSSIERNFGDDHKTTGDHTTTTFEEEKIGSTGRKITRKVKVGSSDGKPTIRVELSSHGPAGPEDAPRSRVLDYGTENPEDGVKRGPQAGRAAVRTAEAVGNRVAAAQPKPEARTISM